MPAYLFSTDAKLRVSGQDEVGNPIFLNGFDPGYHGKIGTGPGACIALPKVFAIFEGGRIRPTNTALSDYTMRTRLLFLLASLVFLVPPTVAQTFTSSNLPILIIDTDGRSIPDEPKIVVDLKIIDNGPGKRNNLTDAPTFSSKIGIELRGSSSQQFPKKPYGIELRDASGEQSVNAPLLGMPSESDWVLNATYNDKTLIREVLTYDLNRQLSSVYTPRYRYCEMVLNGSYNGLYILFEKIKRDKNRIDIANLKKTDVAGDDLTGGYIFKIDKTTGSTSRTWTSPYRSVSGKTVPVQIDRPKPEDLTETQFQYAKKYVTDFEDALQSPQYQDSAVGYRRYANENSFVDYLLLTEVCKNVDGYRLSAYFYKDKDSKGGKLVMGPIWDYNLTYGNANYCNGNDYRGWAYDFGKYCPDDPFSIPFWWDRLLTDRQFANNVRVKYQSLRKNVLETGRIQAYIDSVAANLAEARTRNFQRWPVIGQYVWPNGYVGQTYQQEIDYLKTWVGNRLSWLDAAVQPFGAEVLAVEPTDIFAVTVSPNPSAGDVTVQYQLAKTTDVRLTLLSATGQTVQTVALPGQSAGKHTQTLSGRALPTAPGVYYLQLELSGQVVGKKLIRL